MSRTRVAVLSVFAVSLTLGGCASAPERELSTERPPYVALVDGRDPLNPDQFMPRGAAVSASDEDLFRYYESIRGHALNILQLSGGGQNGAFSAGFLKGWSESGTRPEFDMVTGVSTGALLATHAFLGTPADDAVLAAGDGREDLDEALVRGVTLPLALAQLIAGHRGLALDLGDQRPEGRLLLRLWPDLLLGGAP